MKVPGFNFSQEYIPHGYIELCILPGPGNTVSHTVLPYGSYLSGNVSVSNGAERIPLMAARTLLLDRFGQQGQDVHSDAVRPIHGLRYTNDGQDDR